jgi:hypothetical protein
MDKWLKALIACTCVVVIAGGAWLSAERLMVWNADRNAEKLAKEQAAHSACEKVVKNYNLRLKGVGASGQDSNLVLAALTRDCGSNYPSMFPNIGHANSEALDAARGGESISYKD